MNISNITRVYTGKANACMCGCKGRYRTASLFRNHVGQERGYPVTDDEVSDRSIKLVANRVLNNPNAVRENNYTFVEHNGRVAVVYFKEQH